MKTSQRLLLTVVQLGLTIGCATTGRVHAQPDSWPPADTALGITDPKLRALVEDAWTFTLSDQPLWATQLGVHRFDAEVDNSVPAAVERRRRVRRNLLARAESLGSGLAPDDALAKDVLVAWLSGESGTDVCDFHLWSLSPRSNPVTEWSYLPTLHRITSSEDASNLAARYSKIAASIDAEVGNLQEGLRRGLVTNRHTAELVLEVFEGLLAKPTSEWPLSAPGKDDPPGQPDPARSAAFRKEIRARVDREIRPAFERYAKMLRDELVPKSRPESEIGLSALPNGSACYASQIRRYLGFDRSAESLHELGLAEITRIDAELDKLGREALGSRSLPETLARLRSDPALYFTTSEEVEAKAVAALERARAKIPEAFGTLPKTDCVVTRIPDYEAPFTTVAYYRQPVPDGSKPGEYFINVFAPTTRTRYEAEALAYHESIPGHHLQIAVAQERPNLPAFRRHYGLDAYVEGWGLYAERLSDELGLYSGPLDRLGMFSYEAWRAARLVVDTGLHSKGWTRQQAIDFMRAHTALAPNNIVNEVERYIAWPGQALAYKVGQLEILRLRELARERLGDKFDLRSFHDEVLESGAVPLPILAQRIEAFIAATALDRPQGQSQVRPEPRLGGTLTGPKARHQASPGRSPGFRAAVH
ncbi:MAG: DUF885 domain-containing protein [Deltaproteobacteria bacterium]|nr:DUF885 domain-containing protein [Deltaproteobacteria bacterium]